MPDQSKQISILSPTEFVEGLLAGLAADSQPSITASQTQLHKAFKKILAEANKSEDLKVDLSDIDYDPLYGLSGWLDEFLARAQRDLMISSPNPSYQRIQIELSPEEGNSLLARSAVGDAMRSFSKRFIEELRP